MKSTSGRRMRDGKDTDRASPPPVDRAAILKAVIASKGSIPEAAKLLGVHKSPLQKWINFYGLRGEIYSKCGVHPSARFRTGAKNRKLFYAKDIPILKADVDVDGGNKYVSFVNPTSGDMVTFNIPARQEASRMSLLMMRHWGQDGEADEIVADMMVTSKSQISKIHRIETVLRKMCGNDVACAVMAEAEKNGKS